MAKGIRDIYKVYCETSPEPVPYNRFKGILHEFNDKIVDVLLQGETLDMKNRLSTISIWRKLRDPRQPRVDWGASNKEKARLLEEGKELYDSKTGEGENWLIYHNEERYFRFRWHKDECKVKNKKVYSFRPARGVDGKSPKERLTALVKGDELAYLRFRQYNGDIQARFK